MKILCVTGVVLLCAVFGISASAQAATPSSLNVYPSSYFPVKSTTVTITAQFADANGVPLSDTTYPHTVNWSISGSGSLSASTSTTNGLGYATITLTASSSAGATCTVTASITSPATLSATTTTITTLNAAGTAAKYIVSISSYEPVLSTGGYTVSAQLADANNNPVSASRSVTWSKSGTNGGFSTNPSTTNASGLATTTFTAGSAMTTYVITATDTFSVTGSSSGITTDAVTPAAADVMTTPVAFVDYTEIQTLFLSKCTGCHYTGSGQNPDYSPPTSNSYGHIVGIASSIGLNYVTASDAGNSFVFRKVHEAAPPGNTSRMPYGGPYLNAYDQQLFRDWIDQGAHNIAKDFSVSISGSTVAGSTVTLTAQFRDINNLSLKNPGMLVTWSNIGTGTGGTFSSTTSRTDSSGIATVTFTTSTTAGMVYQFKAVSGSYSGTSSTLTTVAGAATKYVVTSSNYTPLSGDAVTISAQLTDVNGNAVSATRTVNWTKSGAGTFSATQTTTSSGGLATVTLTTTTTSGVGITVTANDGAQNGTSATITTKFAQYKLSYSPSGSVTVGQTITVTAQLVDGSNVALTNSGRSVTLSASGVGGTFVPSTAQSTNSSGNVSASFTTSFTAGSITVTAADAVFSGTLAITNNAGAAAAYRVTPSTTGPVAGAAITVTAQLVDSHNNAVSATNSVTWSVSSGLSGSFSTNPTTTNSSGLATVTFTTNTTVGSATIKATTSTLTGTATITSIAGSPAKYVVTSSATNVAAGTTGITVTAQLADANNNSVSASKSVTFAVNGVGGTFSPSATASTNASGKATVTFTASTSTGTATLSVDDGTYVGTGPTITTVAGPAAKYVVTATPSAPAVSSAVALSAQLTDTYGNAVSTANRTVNWSNTGAGGSYTPATSSLTDFSGLATITFHTSATANTTYVITAADSSFSGSVSITSKAAQYLVSFTPAGAVKVGDTLTVVAQLADGAGTPLAQAGQSVTITATGVGGSFLQSMPQTTDTNGKVTVTFTTSFTAGSITLLAADATSSGSLTFANNPGAATGYNLTTTPPDPVAGTNVTVTAQLVDIHNNAVSAVNSVAWSTTGLSGSFSANPSTTNASGLATVTFTSNTTVGSTTIIGTTGALNGNATITSQPGTPTKYLLSASATSVAAGTTNITLSAQLSDANNNAVSGTATVTFSAGGLGGTLPVPATSTSAAGLATINFDASTSVGTATITATDGTYSGSGLTITTVPGAATQYLVTSSPSSPAPVAGSKVTISAQLADRYGNAVPTSLLTVTWGTVGVNGTFANPTSSTTNGLATIVFTAGNVAGPYTLTASDGTHNGSVSFSTQAGQYLVSYTPLGNVTVGQTITVNAQLADGTGAPLAQAGQAANFSVTGAGGVFTPTSQTTDATGLASVSFLCSNTAGTSVLTAADSANTGSLSIVVKSSNATAFRVTATNTTPTVGSSITVDAQLIDAFGNSVGTPNISVTFSTTGLGGTFGANPVFTDANGLASVQFTPSTTAGATTIKAADSTHNGTVAITTQAGPPIKYIVTPATLSTTAGSTGMAVTAQLADAYDNPVSAVRTVTWGLTGVGGSFSANPTTTIGGLATVSFNASTTAGTDVISADDGTFFGASAAIDVTPGPASTYRVTSSSTLPAAGTTVTLTAQLTDVYGNFLSTAGLQVNWSAAPLGVAGNFAAPFSTTVNGVATVAFTTSTTSGVAYTLTGTDSNLISGSVGVTTIPGTPVQCLLNVTPLNPVAGTAVSVTGQLADVYGNNVVRPGVGIIWSSNASGSFSQAVTPTDPSGQVSVSFTTGRKSGVTYVLSATDGLAIHGSSAGFTSLSGAPAGFTVAVSNTAPIAGAALTVTAQLIDTNGNSLPTAGQTVTWGKTGTGGSFAAPTSDTDASGVATVSFTSAILAGTVQTLTASSGGFTGSSPAITTLNGPAVKYVVNVSTTSVSAGSAVRISAQLMDANGNAVTTAGKTVTWTTSGPNGFFSSPTTLTNSSGLATVVLSTSPQGGVDYVVTATDTDGLTGVGADIVVTAGSVSLGASPLITSALTATTAAGASFTYAITALGDQPMTFSAAPLPPGLTLSGDMLVGAVVVSGTYVTHLTAVNAAGSDSIDLVIVVSPSQDVSLDKGQVKLNFAASNADALSAVFSFTLPDGVSAQNAVVTVRFGNATFANMTAAKVQARMVSGAAITLKPLAKGSSSVRLTLVVKGSNLKDVLAGNGLVNDDITQAIPLNLPLVVSLSADAGTFYCTGQAALTYKAKKNKSGIAKK